MRVAILLAVMLSACAKPNYVNADPGRAQGKTEKCEVRFAGSNQCVSLTWEIPPGDRTLGTFLLKVYRLNAADGSMVLENANGNIDIELGMPGMNHGSNSPIVVTPVDTGTYRVSGVIFSMRGKWEIHVQIKQGTVVRDEAIVPYTY